MAQRKILIDTNSYFRLAQSIRPLLKVEFGVESYCLYVIKEMQEEYNANPRLRSRFHWVNEPEYVENRSHKLQVSRKERLEIEQTYEFIYDHARSEYPGVSRVDVRVLAHAYVLGVPVVTDDADMTALAEDFEIEVMRTLDLLKLMLDCGHVDMAKVREVAEYVIYGNDRPKDFRRDYRRHFEEDPPR